MSESMTSPAVEASEEHRGGAFDFMGRILRKKNISSEYLKLAVQEDGKEKSVTVYIPRNEPKVCTPSSSEFNFLYLGAIIHVMGSINEEDYHHVTQCTLVKCAPNIKMIKEALALPNYLTLASAMCMDETDLQTLVEVKKSQKVRVNTIIERITGKKAKAPPKYRVRNVKRSDLEVLEHKETEGNNGSNPDWMLCQPCQSVNDAIGSFDAKKESVVNLPEGADHIVSAHGKLTRSEYLETKKNNQSTWFIERIRKLNVPPTTKFLDVGGGRGDLAVQIVLNFPQSRMVVVDSNERSVEGGRGYARKCKVDDRIEFICMNFTEYAEQYDKDAKDGIDFVVALHACGDLSDMALSFASSNKCNFIICPCCYPKRYLAPFVPHWHGLCKTKKEIDSLSRLVELDDHREVSRRAMLVVNSMRRSAFERKDQDVGLEEFDDKISKRNIALVGVGCLS